MTGLSNLRIGTLSFELNDWKPVHSSKERREAIRDVCWEFSPDILVCAGFSVDSPKDISWLTKQELSPFCYVEAREGGKNNGNTYYLIWPGSRPNIKFEPQIFATREDCSKSNILKLENASKRNHKSIRDLGAYLLVCGELNILEGRTPPHFLSDIIENNVTESDIIINPNHDRMNDRGVLQPKRSMLSKSIGRRHRLYVNSANWNRNKSRGSGKRPINQNRDACTLHNVYVSGKAIKMERKTPDRFYEYREAVI